MSSNSFQIFINQCIQLAETLVIKSAISAELINQWVYAYSGNLLPVSSDPTTWKYYMNLAGEYHWIDYEQTTPNGMMIASLDTQGQIPFNIAELQSNPATARAYQYGSKYYVNLVNQYPAQEQLILGILYPVSSIDNAINARDNKILAYPANLIESNEFSLINKIQEFIDAYRKRWYIPAFTITDELYEATNLGIMYLMLIPAIINARLEACNTNEAHSFHVREYLKSHGFLDVYINSLTLTQSLYFYRNIAFIERNPGKRSTFNLLVKNILTPQNVPLAAYSMNHNTANQTTTMYPEVVFTKTQLNLGQQLQVDNTITIPEMLTKESGLTIGNALNLTEVTTEIQTIMENSPNNSLPTKVLESTMIDETNSSPVILPDILFNEWIDLCCGSNNFYGNVYVEITNPHNDAQFTLLTKDSLILAIYAFGCSVGITPEFIPTITANRVQRIPIMTPAGIYSLVDNSIVNNNVAVAALLGQPVLSNITSIDDFYNTCVSIFNQTQTQRLLLAGTQDFMAYGMVKNMIDAIYSDNTYSLAPVGTTYSSWLISRNLDFSALSITEFATLYQIIVAQATGAALHITESLPQLQAALIGLFTQLSSYGIQIIAEINKTPFRQNDWPGIQIGELSYSVSGSYVSPNNGITVLSHTSLTHQVIAVDELQYSPIPEIFTTLHHSVTSTRCNVSVSEKPTEIISINSSSTKLNLAINSDMPSFSTPSSVNGLSEFLALPLPNEEFITILNLS